MMKKNKLSTFKQGFWLYYINIGLLIVLILTFLTNQALLNKVNNDLGLAGSLSNHLSPLSFLGGNKGGDIDLSGELGDDVVKLVISTGVPKIYGPELEVSFDQVQGSINIMKQFDPAYGNKKIALAGDDLQRYIDVGLRISCEYCCGAKSIIRADGEAACGCAHSIAMRGLMAYLIKNHGSEYTNDEILRELARWKGVYFPKQMIKKLASQIQGEQFTPDTAALILDLDLPKYSGAAGDVPLPSEIKNLPSMVGGC